MDGYTQELQDTVSEETDHILSYKYDRKFAERVMRSCGSAVVKANIPYLRIIEYRMADKMMFCRIGDEGFYIAVANKDSVRLHELAVKSEAHGKGIGEALMRNLISRAKKAHKKKITLRTSREAGAAGFYQRFGAKLEGIDGSDYLMEITVK